MRVKRTLTIFLSLIVLITGYSNCSATKFNSKTQAHTQNSGGDYYTGKPRYYSHFASQQCTTLGKNGQPLPNRQIFLQKGAYQLVRENCADLATPTTIPMTDLTISEDMSSVVYQGQTFAFDTNFANYDLMNTRCPAGFTSYNTAAANLYLDPFDLSTSRWNTFHPMMDAVLDGVIGALPRYLIEVKSPNSADWFDWQRIAQGVVIEPNTQYAVRFILRPGTRSGASLQYWDGINGWAMSIDLLSSGLTLRQVTGPVPTGINEPYIYGAPGSRIVTVFFTTTAGTTGTDLGIAPLGDGTQGTVQPGYSIYATAADLRKVSDYCRP